jgi:YbgC/YbaW family acyl-CoA thioester hydrolase
MASSGSPRWSEYTLRRRVLFYEVDWAGIVHFSNYFRYMEEAEHALWRDAGLSIARSATGVGFPRVEATFSYRRPLRFEDEFEARIRIVELREKRLKYACTLWCRGEEVATGAMTVVCVRMREDGTMKAAPIPPAIASRFAVSAEVDG